MGAVANIDYDKFPKQSNKVGKQVQVCFNYKTDTFIQGTIVREDMEEPGRMIIKLDDGRFILDTECHYSYIPLKVE